MTYDLATQSTVRGPTTVSLLGCGVSDPTPNILNQNQDLHMIQMLRTIWELPCKALQYPGFSRPDLLTSASDSFPCSLATSHADHLADPWTHSHLRALYLILPLAVTYSLSLNICTNVTLSEKPSWIQSSFVASTITWRVFTISSPLPRPAP